MSLNYSVVNGKLPHFDPNYKEGNGDKKSVLNWAVSVPRDIKKDTDQYYPEDLINITAFGSSADFIMKHFAQGDGIIVEGRLQRSDDYTDKNTGEQKKGSMYLLVNKVDFAYGNSNKSNNSSNTNAAPAVSHPQTTGTRPAAPVGRPPIGPHASAGRPPVGRAPWNGRR